MPVYALKIEYDGGPFAGWQRQAGGLTTVQGVLETALSRLGEAQTVPAAGRTDAGVHATGQVAGCEMRRAWNTGRLAGALNHHLRPWPVSVVDCAEVPEAWHPRFDALGRRYLFRLVARRAPVTHDRGRVWQVGHRLDVDAMRVGAAALIGRHDFTTFRSAHCQAASPVKTLDGLVISEVAYPEGVEYRFELAARSFLHNQVRSIVGTLERVGAGAWEAGRVGEALAARDRAACGPVCAPDGLYLVGVDYGMGVF